jgi:hypothetical protein
MFALEACVSVSEPQLVAVVLQQVAPVEAAVLVVVSRFH